MLTILGGISADAHSVGSEVISAFGHSIVEGYDAVQDAVMLMGLGVLIAVIGGAIIWGVENFKVNFLSR